MKIVLSKNCIGKKNLNTTAKYFLSMKSCIAQLLLLKRNLALCSQQDFEIKIFQFFYSKFITGILVLFLPVIEYDSHLEKIFIFGYI